MKVDRRMQSESITEGHFREHVLSHAEQWGLVAERMPWIDNWFPGYVDIRVSLLALDSRSAGRAIAESEDLAVSKAVSEALERYVFLYSKDELTTSGLAVHTSLDQATEGAIKELIERDAFLCHYFSRTPFLKLTTENSFKSSRGLNFCEIKDRLSDLNIAIHAAAMRVCDPYFSYCIAAFGAGFSKPFGVLVGLGCHRDESAAFEGALFECLRSVAAAISDNIEISPLNRAQFESTQEPRVEHQLAFALHPTTGSELLRLFTEARHGVYTFQSSEGILKSITTRLMALPPQIGDTPIFCVRAQSEKLQKLFFGQTTEDKIKLPRLSQFIGSPVAFSDVEKTPHPLA